MPPVIYGSAVATRISTEDSWKSVGEGEFVEVYEAEYSAAEAFATALISSLGAEAVTLSRNGGMGQVLVNTASQFAISPNTPGIWQIEPMDLEKPLESFPGGIVAESTFNTDSAGISNDLALARAEFEKGNFLYTPGTTTGQNYFNLLKRGTEAYLRGYVTVTWQRTVRKNNVQANIDYHGVDRAWKETDPYGPSNMPSVVVGALADVPEYDVSKKQFLKRWPSIRTDDGRNYTITQTWIWARRWSQLLYDGDEKPNGQDFPP